MSKSVNLDSLDSQIVALLRHDGRMPYTAIAKQLGVAEATVRKRMHRLVDEGVVTIVGLLNPEYTGHGVTAIVGVHTEGNRVPAIVEEVSSWQEVRYAAACAGNYDFILEVVVASLDELYDFLTNRLRATPGVVGSDTSLVMRTLKDRHQWDGVIEYGQSASSDDAPLDESSAHQNEE